MTRLLIVGAVTRPFRFGVRFNEASSRRDWLETVKAVEGLGYSTVFCSDHFLEPLAPLPALILAAEATNLRIGTFVLDNDFRHPAVLAKEAATIDLLTEGRLELGLGAGWLSADYKQSGIPFDPPRVRVDRLEEAVKVIKGFFEPDPFTFAGRHYQTRELVGLPRPQQQPHPPLLIGGGGRRVLELAGREADIVSVFYNLRAEAFFADGSAAVTDQKIQWVREAAGGRFPNIELCLHLLPVIETRERHEHAESVSEKTGVSAKEVLETPFMLIGNVDEMCEALQQRRERFGFSYVVVPGEYMRALAQVVERLTGS